MTYLFAGVIIVIAIVAYLGLRGEKGLVGKGYTSGQGESNTPKKHEDKLKRRSE